MHSNPGKRKDPYDVYPGFHIRILFSPQLKVFWDRFLYQIVGTPAIHRSTRSKHRRGEVAPGNFGNWYMWFGYMVLVSTFTVGWFFFWRWTSTIQLIASQSLEEEVRLVRSGSPWSYPSTSFSHSYGSWMQVVSVFRSDYNSLSSTRNLFHTLSKNFYLSLLENSRSYSEEIF